MVDFTDLNKNKHLDLEEVQTVEQFIEFCINSVMENFIASLIFILLIGLILYNILQDRYLNDRRIESRHRNAWKQIRMSKELLTNNLVMSVSLIGGGKIPINGDIYILDTYIDDHVPAPYKPTREQKTAPVYTEPAPSALPPVVGKPEKPIIKELQEKYTPSAKPETDTAIQTFNPPDVTSRPPVPRRTRTDLYVALLKMPKTSRWQFAHAHMVLFRKSGLNLQGTLLDETKEHRLRDIDPTLMWGLIKQTYLVVFAIYSLLLYAMVTAATQEELNKKVMFFVDRVNLPWYVVIGVFFFMRFKLLNERKGRKGTMYADVFPQMTVKFQNKLGESITFSASVLNVKLLEHPDIPIENVLDIDTSKLATERNRELEKDFSKISAENASLKIDLEVQRAICHEKDVKLDQFENRISETWHDGYFVGATKVEAVIPRQQTPGSPQTQRPSETAPILKELKWPAIIVIILVGVFYLFSSMNVTNSGGSSGPTFDLASLTTPGNLFLFTLITICLYLLIKFAMSWQVSSGR